MKSFFKFVFWAGLIVGGTWFLMTKTGFGPKAMTIASSMNQDKLLKVFMLVGADPDKPAGGGTTPLQAAAYEQSNVALQFLIEKGVDLDATDDEGRTALHLAAYKGFKDTIRILVEAGADTEIHEDTGGMTPLHVAVVRQKMEAIKELLDLGARINARASGGLTAVGLAGREGDIGMAKFLRGRGGR